MLGLSLVGLLASAAVTQANRTVCEVKTRSYIIPAPTIPAGNLTELGAGFTGPPVEEQNFLLQVVQSGSRAIQRRQSLSVGFLSSNGSILPSCQSASDFLLRSGQLASDSLSYSTSQGVRDRQFVGTQVQQPITTLFSVDDGFLGWKNAAFDGGAARFCAQPSRPLLAVFSGPLPEGYSNVVLRTVARSACSTFDPVGQTVLTSEAEVLPTYSSSSSQQTGLSASSIINLTLSSNPTALSSGAGAESTLSPVGENSTSIPSTPVTHLTSTSTPSSLLSSSTASSRLPQSFLTPGSSDLASSTRGFTGISSTKSSASNASIRLTNPGTSPYSSSEPDVTTRPLASSNSSPSAALSSNRPTPSPTRSSTTTIIAPSIASSSLSTSLTPVTSLSNSRSSTNLSTSSIVSTTILASSIQSSMSSTTSSSIRTSLSNSRSSTSLSTSSIVSTTIQASSIQSSMSTTTSSSIRTSSIPSSSTPSGSQISATSTSPSGETASTLLATSSSSSTFLPNPISATSPTSALQNSPSSDLSNQVSSTSTGIASTSSSFTPISSPSSTTTSSLMTLSSSTVDPVSQASAIILSSSLRVFCTVYLGFTSSQATVSTTAVTTSTALITIIPSQVTVIRTITNARLSTILSSTSTTVTTPTSTVSVAFTATSIVTTTVTTVQSRTSTIQTVIVQKRAERPALQIRQAPTILATPAPLQTFDVVVLSAACNLFASSPPPASAVTTTYSSRVLQTSYVTQPAITVFSTSIVSTDATVSSGASTSTRTAPVATLTVTRTVIATNFLTVTSTSTAFTISTSTSIRSTSTSTSSTSTTSEDINSSAPTVLLATPTAILGSAAGAPEYIDDASVFVDLPIRVQIGQNSSSRIYVSSNGILALFDGSTNYENAELPVSYVPEISLFPFWDDTYIDQGKPQGVFYTITGGTDIIFEYYFTHFGGTDEYYHYLVSYSTNRPGIFTFTYYDISDSGISATVGAQYSSPPTVLQYSVNSATITPGLVLTVDTIRGIITPSTTNVT